jgi:hypothetical protein
VKTPAVEFDELSGVVRGEVIVPGYPEYDAVRKPTPTMARFDDVRPAAVVGARGPDPLFQAL